MTLELLHRRLGRILCGILAINSRYHTPRQQSSSTDTNIFKQKWLSRKIFGCDPIKPTCFHNVSEAINHVSTYENLVNQKLSNPASSEKKCQQKPHPGRHKFHKEVEEALNEQVFIEMNASFAYLAMACFYGRTEVALPGCQGFFMNMHQEEHEHAIIFMNYILMRGGHVKIPAISPPKDQDWSNVSEAFATAAEMESIVKEKIECMFKLSEKHEDFQLCDFLSGPFLEEQNKSVCSMGRLFTRSKMAKDEVGLYLFDQHVYDSFVKQSKDNLMYTTDLPPVEVNKVYK